MNLFNLVKARVFWSTAVAIILGCLFISVARAEEGEEAPPPPPPPVPTITINNPDTSFPEQVKIVTATASRGVLTWQMLTDSNTACNGSVQDFMPYEPAEFDDSQNGYRACYRAVDELGQTTYAVSNVITGVDNTFPDLSLRGSAEVIVYLGESYNDAGATAVDNFDGVVAVTSIGSVDINTVGTYYIVYNTIDRAGNVASGLTRTILVRDRSILETNNQDTQTDNSTSPTNQPTTNTQAAGKIVYCSAVVYGEWLPCGDGLQFRTVVSKSPTNCLLSSAQQAVTARSCQANYCTNVFYGKWSACANGKQTREITSQVPAGCLVTAHQLLFKSKTCSTVLGQKVAVNGSATTNLPAKNYPNGSLLRNAKKQIFVIVNSKKQPVSNLKELAKYRGKPIIEVTDEELTKY